MIPRAILGLSVLLPLCMTARELSADEGMWPFNHLPTVALKKKYGFEPSREWLARVERASVRVAGCSGSFVSANGLTLTNHHCAEECISRLSSTKQDYIANGFSAQSAGDEKVCPGVEIHGLREISDVTARVQSATAGLEGEAFQRAFNAESAKIEQACMVDGDRVCEVVSLYHGGLYELYQYQRYRDVRLVFAPEVASAFFGGDPDNFNFPRYNLDVAFLRAYSDAKPASTPEYLSFSRAELRPNDLTFTSGNPGSTERLLTTRQLADRRDQTLLEDLLSLARYRGFLSEYAERGGEARRVSASELFSVENGFKALRGEHRALIDRDFFAELVQKEQALVRRVSANAASRNKYAGAWKAIESAQSKLRGMELELRWIEGLGSRPLWAKTSLFSWARSLVRAAEEVPKKNEERLPEFTAARLPGLEQRLLAQRPLDTSFETAKLAFGLTMLREELGTDHPFVKKVLGKSSPEELAGALVKGSKLESVGERKRLWQGGKAAVQASTDPMIQLALAIDPEARKLRTRYENEVESVLTKNSELIARARFEAYGMSSYPDATFSPRLSFGTVRGWREQGKLVPAFTTLRGAFERATGRFPYALPASWLEKQKQLEQDTPFNFVTDNDIVGGNSGSPVIDRKGDLVGLVFDGNIHSLGGTYGYDISKNRMVAVDVRAILHALDVIYGAKRLTAELAGNGAR
jgi:hypothetical protein